MNTVKLLRLVKSALAAWNSSSESLHSAMQELDAFVTASVLTEPFPVDPNTVEPSSDPLPNRCPKTKDGERCERGRGHEGECDFEYWPGVN